MVILKPLAVAVASAALLVGCAAVGPDYRLPAEAKLNAPAAQGPFVGAKGQSAVAVDAPPGRWWGLYRSADLDRLETQALAANTDLRVAEANLQRSRAIVAGAQAQGQPNVSFGGSAGYGQFSSEAYLQPEYIPPVDLYDVGLTASWDLDLFGRIRRGVEAAKADDEAVEAARDAARVAVAADVARAYAEVCSAGEQLVAARQSLALQQQGLQLTRALVAGGRGGKLDITRLQGQVDQFRASIPTLQADQRNALFRLATLTGHAPAEFEPALERCEVAPVLQQPIPVGDGAALLKRRPDVRAAERRLAAATAEVGVATAGLYPDVRLGGSIGSTGAMQDVLKATTNRYAIGPEISWELNHSAARARIDQAKAATQADLARFDGVVLGALRETESALSTYGHDLERTKSLQAAAAEADSALADARRLQGSGRSGALTTLDAERVQASTSAALAALHAKLAQDQIALFLALGGGWGEGSPEVAAN